MKSFIPTLAAFLLASPILAKKINLGIAYYDSGNVDNAFWIDGEDACNYVYAGHLNGNPCDYLGEQLFWLQDGYQYKIKDCTTVANLFNANGLWFGSAYYSPYVQAGANCGNSGGGFHVDQHFQFDSEYYN